MQKRSNTKSLLINKGQKSAIMKPQLTSLIDVMTILLVFLLKSFSVDGNLVSISPELELAKSQSKAKPVMALNIEVTPEDVVVDGYKVTSLASVLASDSMMIDDLYAKLREVADSPRMIANNGRIIIQCDKVVDFKILKKIMYTCGKAKFLNFSLLVAEKA
jgi:biopolymer transport protein ExbD